MQNIETNFQSKIIIEFSDCQNCATKRQKDSSKLHVRSLFTCFIAQYSFFVDRQKVLLYHPDKGKQKSGARNEMIFACIQKAYEQLGLDSDKRRAYDSVDPKFVDEIPESDAIGGGNFFEMLSPVFDRFSRCVRPSLCVFYDSYRSLASQ